MKQFFVIGLGYVGINLFNSLQKNFYNVIGVDSDNKKINKLKKGIDPSNEIKNFKSINNSKFSNTIKKYINPENENYFFICVPTPINKISKKPELVSIKKCLLEISKLKLNKKFFIINESSVYPGQTETLVNHYLQIKGLVLNKDYFIAFSPERINPGDSINKLENINKVVASNHKITLGKIVKIYKKIIKKKVIPSNSIFEAEAAKLIENTQRDINIAFMNEAKEIFSKTNANFENILKLAETKWNFCKFKPGYVGGHCIAVDPYYLIEYAVVNKRNHNFISLARKVNEYQVVNLKKKILKIIKKIEKKYTKILILGITYKANVPDLRESQALKLINLLNKNDNFEIFFYDPISSTKLAKKFNISQKTKFDVVVKMSMHNEIVKDLEKLQKNFYKNTVIL